MDKFIAADCGIRQLYARFADAVFRLDGDAFADCFSEDGVWKIAGMEIATRAVIREKFDLLLSTSAKVQIITGTPVLEVGEGEASGRIQLTELVKLKDGGSAITIGTYFDRYVEAGGVWRFSWRHFSLHYRGPIDLSADLVDSPDYGPPPAMPALDAPTLTRRAPDPE